MKLSLPWRDPRPAFRYPVSTAGRTVVFHPVFKRSSNLLYVDPLAPEAPAHIQSFRPASIAGHLEVVLKFAGSAQPTHSLIIFTPEGKPCLHDESRNELWNAYQLPIFEQVIGDTGRVAAWECEAHEGLHLIAGTQVAPGCTLETKVCNCGVSSPRVVHPTLAPAFMGVRGTATLRLPGRLESATRPLPT